MDKKNVRIIFLLPNDCETELQTSDEMQQAFEACKQNGVRLDWQREQDCLDLQLNKTDFVVFQTFEGEAFQKIKQTKSVRIVGPWCLLTCLMEGKQIPNFPWPLYSVAMMGCTITCSSLPKPKKKEIQDKIEYMAGCFSTSLTEKCTHLITDTVKSEKYIKAAETRMKLVLSSWVEDVWEAAQKANVHCNDKQFDKHRCPTFHSLVVCCTGLAHGERNILEKLITENGGVYREQLHVSSTDILVCDSSSISAKYKAAKKRNIKCVTFQWATDSIENGYAMPDNLYPVKVGTSTPTKDGEDIYPNFSMISNIENTSTLLATRSQFLDTIDVTEMSKLNSNTPAKEPTNLKRKSNSNEHNDLVDEIDLKQVKQAGPFLDGCGIYLAGFGVEQREKLCKVLNFSGATRYDDVTERVTHVLVGDASCHDLRVMSSRDSFKNCPLVSIQWLLDSIAKKYPVDEAPYLVTAVTKPTDEPSSPLSKKGLHLLRTKSGIESEKPETIVHPEPEIDIVQQYLCPNASSQEDTLAKLLQDASTFNTKQNSSQDRQNTDQFVPKQDEVSTSKQAEAQKSSSSGLQPYNKSISGRDASLSSAVDESSQPTEPIYEGFRFIIAGFEEAQQNQVKIAIEAMAGKVVSRAYKGVPDYAVVPVFSSQLKQVATEIVTDLWITECWQENEVRSIEYFHRPISVKDGVQPLKNCVVTISSYTNYERNFLKNLIALLGGTCQEQFSRITSTKTGVVACTHLVSPEPSGRKYTAAIKWGIPVVNKDWLLECARASQLPSESSFLVGEAKCSSNSASSISTENKSILDSVSKSNPASTRKLSSPKPSAFQVSDLANEFTKFPFPPPKPKQTTTSKSKLSDDNSFNTPPAGKLHTSNSEQTPENRLLKDVQNTSDICSQVTPVRNIIAEARKHNLLGTPKESLPFPKPWDHVDTPETPLGAFIHPNPSPNLRKQMVRFLNTLPEYKPRRDSTPLSELKRQLWDKICPPKDGENAAKPKQPNFDMEVEVFDNVQENSEKPCTPSKPSNFNIPDNIVNNQLQQLQEMLTSSGGSRMNSRSKRQSIIPVASTEVKDSQPNTIGWDDCMECDDAEMHQKVVPVFMFSGIEQENREILTAQLENLGAVVTNSSNYDPLCTHLICPKPMRNEKILACIASGKWILHTSYVEKCSEEGKLVDEELYEYGNPKSKGNIHMQGNKENEARELAMHYWRKEIARRNYGPFHDMRAIIVAQKKEPIVRILQAGGGMIIEASPPFTQTIHATHCLIETKSVKNLADFIPLATQGIYCINTLYVSECLQRTANDVRDYILPALAEYYKSK